MKERKRFDTESGTWWIEGDLGDLTSNVARDPDGRFGIAFLNDTGEMLAFVTEPDMPNFLEMARKFYPKQGAQLEKLMAEEFPKAKAHLHQFVRSINN